MPSFVSNLESAIDGTVLSADKIQTLHKDRPLWVRYDLDKIKRSLQIDNLKNRPHNIWRYKELLPLSPEDSVISLGEVVTPIISCEKLGKKYGLDKLYIKDESSLPTGSFKSRGLVMAVNMAKKFGVKTVAIPTAGNAGGAMAAYAARAGMDAYVFMPEDTPLINKFECKVFGAKAFLINGLIGDCGKIVRDGKDNIGWFDMSTLKEPYRIEGKKTMGLELAEQFNWRSPDVILYPTGGGTGLIGMWKAFNELDQLGWLKDGKRPRMVAVQSDGCCPIVRAFDAGERFAEPVENPYTIASGIRVPSAIGDFMILDAVRESGGKAIAVPEEKIIDYMELTAKTEGISICPETAACVVALEMLSNEGWLQADEEIVIFNTAAAQKYPDITEIKFTMIDIGSPIDWDIIRR
ncbi:MAG: threonine synthase [Candidatus Zixiibacteriota bacterium]|nr:MAG: threonine synthase [candidate division Zixibacteria bacterium]